MEHITDASFLDPQSRLGWRIMQELDYLRGNDGRDRSCKSLESLFLGPLYYGQSVGRLF